MNNIERNCLVKIMPSCNILLDLYVTSKKRAFEQIGLLFENYHGLARSVVFESLFARERLGSTALGHGLALPHGQIKDLPNITVAFLRLKKPVNFNAVDGQLVTLILCLLIPKKTTQKHLEILVQLSRILSNGTLRTILDKEEDKEKIYHALTTIELS